MRALAILVMACAVIDTAWATRGGWPPVPAPDALEHFRVGREMTVNGAPVRMDVYVVQQGMDAVRDWYRARLPGNSVENRVGQQLVLAQRRGDYFITISLEPMPDAVSINYTKVLVAIVGTGAGRAMEADRHNLPAALRDWPRRLPAASQVINELRDNADGRRSLQLTAVNRQGLMLNESHLRRELELLGFRLQARKQSHEGQQQGLLFEAPSGEAVLVLGRVGDGLSTIFLNISMRSRR